MGRGAGEAVEDSLAVEFLTLLGESKEGASMTTTTEMLGSPGEGGI